ncbi:MAG: YidC/Oxa1 family membrane protein insertase [Epulopiscium sp.]|nr:YidC/Oxa1 family membrane protein insertase [Candidatus Epulonipiscium sp.]
MIDSLAKILGVVLNQVFDVIYGLSPVGSLGITIILFTIFVKVLMLPLMLNQQKSMKRMQKVQPEIQKIQDKYKNKKDPESQKQMNQELGEFYQNNKINPLGGCLPLIIQMPIFLALFRVLQRAGTYITKLHDLYYLIATKITTVQGYEVLLKEIVKDNPRIKLSEDTLKTVEGIQSILPQLTTNAWHTITSKFPGIPADTIVNKENIEYFLGISLVDSPSDLMGQGVIVAVVLFVFISGFTTFLSSKVMTMGNKQQQNDQALQTQKTMNMIFPLLTAWMTYSLPAGLGIYWITSNIFQIVQQIGINKYMEKVGEGE